MIFLTNLIPHCSITAISVHHLFLLQSTVFTSENQQVLCSIDFLVAISAFIMNVNTTFPERNRIRLVAHPLRIYLLFSVFCVEQQFNVSGARLFTTNMSSQTIDLQYTIDTLKPNLDPSNSTGLCVVWLVLSRIMQTKKLYSLPTSQNNSVEMSHSQWSQLNEIETLSIFQIHTNISKSIRNVRTIERLNGT